LEVIGHHVLGAQQFLRREYGSGWLDFHVRISA
jgi:hypothetical protein